MSYRRTAGGKASAAFFPPPTPPFLGKTSLTSLLSGGERSLHGSLLCPHSSVWGPRCRRAALTAQSPLAAGLPSAQRGGTDADAFLSFFLSLFYYYSFLILLITNYPGENSLHSRFPPSAKLTFFANAISSAAAWNRPPLVRLCAVLFPAPQRRTPRAQRGPAERPPPTHTSPREAEQSRAGSGREAAHGRSVLRAAAGMRSPERLPR